MCSSAALRVSIVFTDSDDVDALLFVALFVDLVLGNDKVLCLNLLTTGVTLALWHSSVSLSSCRGTLGRSLSPSLSSTFFFLLLISNPLLLGFLFLLREPSSKGISMFASVGRLEQVARLVFCRQ